MKKILAILLAGTMMMAMSACNKEVEPEEVPREPVNPVPSGVIVGNYNLSAEYLAFEAPVITDESDSPDMDVLGNNIYITNGGNEVKVYTLDGSNLNYVKTIEVESTGDSISVDGNGKIYVDGGVFEAKIYDPETSSSGKAVASGVLTASKTSDFALTYFTGDETITAIKDGVADAWGVNGEAGLGAFKMISVIEIVDDTVLIGGEDDENYIIGAYDLDGNQLMLSGGCLEGSLPNAVCKTQNGYISSSVEELTFVDTTGAIIGDIDVDELFGISENTVWVHEMSTLPDGSILMLAQLSKSGVIGDETVLFKVSGF